MSRMSDEDMTDYEDMSEEEDVNELLRPLVYTQYYYDVIQPMNGRTVLTPQEDTIFNQFMDETIVRIQEELEVSNEEAKDLLEQFLEDNEDNVWNPYDDRYNPNMRVSTPPPAPKKRGKGRGGNRIDNITDADGVRANMSLAELNEMANDDAHLYRLIARRNNLVRLSTPPLPPSRPPRIQPPIIDLSDLSSSSSSSSLGAPPPLFPQRPVHT